MTVKNFYRSNMQCMCGGGAKHHMVGSVRIRQMSPYLSSLPTKLKNTPKNTKKNIKVHEKHKLKSLIGSKAINEIRKTKKDRIRRR